MEGQDSGTGRACIVSRDDELVLCMYMKRRTATESESYQRRLLLVEKGSIRLEVFRILTLIHLFYNSDNLSSSFSTKTDILVNRNSSLQ